MPEQKNSLVVENELMLISLSKAAREVFEELSSTDSRTDENGDEYPHGGEDPYETIQDVKDTMILGDSLSRVCWGTNAKDNRSYYIADTGHMVTVKPRDEKDTKSDSVKKVEKFLEQWFKENQWFQRQSETSQRLDRHGEAWDLLHYSDDGILRTNFAEPTDLEDDPASIYTDGDPESQRPKLPFIDLFGVRRTNDIRYRPVQYFINDQWYPDLAYVTPMGVLPEPVSLVESTTVQHRKRNCLANDPRGYTLYWPVREEMIWAKKLLSNLMRVSGFQAAFGAIRTIQAGMGADKLGSWLASQQTGAGSAGQYETFGMPAAGVVTKPESIHYEFPTTGQGFTNHIEVLVNLLRACASGMKLPEFMLTANVSEGNFASTLVSEGPFHKAMRFEQALMVSEDERILMQALKYAASKGVMDLTEADVDAVRMHIKPPRVQTRNRKEDFEVNQTLYEAGELSGKDWLASEGYERDSQQAQIKIERSAEQSLPLGSPHAATANAEPGPKPKKKADPTKEKGVSKGFPK